NGDLLCSSNGHFFEVDPVTLSIREIHLSKRDVRQEDSDQLITLTIIPGQQDQYWFGGYSGLFQLERGNHEIEFPFNAGDQQKECFDLIIANKGITYALYDGNQLVEADVHRTKLHVIPIPVEYNGSNASVL